ncbi:hypothetical protein AMAG_12357 [Allomyces macrogynus ATCC 38327]|uniref:Uncharacterized protein n=1 Tax=Allomyces macrogynus (strain ATCC 38327) TaxID=578462 RepID=A0A0L0SXQ4_ALLM3|nr:hypothetical protein AMAG_12357 [Allomyces macrogynus ATCC 38327]|eukprot:KNE67292.1 hypothetical protein AMAG_12357 [Allomyces macrogynus ATCC 38327]
MTVPPRSLVEHLPNDVLLTLYDGMAQYAGLDALLSFALATPIAYAPAIKASLARARGISNRWSFEFRDHGETIRLESRKVIGNLIHARCPRLHVGEWYLIMPLRDKNRQDTRCSGPFRLVGSLAWSLLPIRNLDPIRHVHLQARGDEPEWMPSVLPPFLSTLSVGGEWFDERRDWDDVPRTVTHLELQWCHMDVDIAQAFMASMRNSLRRLTIKYYEHHRAKFMDTILRACPPGIKQLELVSRGPYSVAANIGALLDVIPTLLHLETFRIMNCPNRMPLQLLAALAAAPNLHVMRLGVHDLFGREP